MNDSPMQTVATRMLESVEKLKLATEIDQAGEKLTEAIRVAEEIHPSLVDDLLALKDVVNKLKVKVINEIK